MDKLREAARQALEALETLDCGDSYKTHNAATALREALAEQAEQEPVAWMNEERNTITWNELYPNMTPLYAAPVRTKDLTDAEIAALVQRHTIDGKIMPFALCEAVIAADREKNK